MLKIGDGRRLVLPRENLQALVGATAEQAADFVVGPHGTYIWWPQVDAGHYLPNLLEGRFGSEAWMEKLQRLGVRLSAGASRQVAAAGEVSSEIGFVFR